MGELIDEIRVCPNHQKKEKVPLIFTMAFIGQEYWCPACGYTSGMLGAGDIIKITPELEKSAEEWKEKGKDYLSVISAKNCESLLHEGKRMTYHELPEKEKNRLQKIKDNWKYKY